MEENNKTILATLDTKEKTENILNQLSRTGYNTSDASIVMRDSQTGQEVSQNTGANYGEGAVAGASSGAVTGGTIGAIGGLLAGIGVFAIPGGILIGGPIAAALGLTGAAATTLSGAVTGAAAGGLVGALVGLGVAREQAQDYENAVNQGNILLYLPVKSISEDKIREILNQNDANNINVIG